MSQGGYKVTDQGAMYFVSFAAIGWVDVFSRDYGQNINSFIFSVPAESTERDPA